MIFPECAAEACHAVDNRRTCGHRLWRGRGQLYLDSIAALPEIPARILVEGMVRPGFLGNKKGTRRVRAGWKAESGAARRPNAPPLLDDGWSCK